MSTPPSQPASPVSGAFPIRAVAGCFALASFSVAIVSGLLADRPTESVIFSAVVAMVVGQFVGLGAGAVMSVALRESIDDYLARHPVPGEPGARSPGAGAERPA
ncbi:MAG TPA: hypothetical protein DEB06_10480 [Phycisphaerales bacterium]|nr:hypothetical protein [Phycisphaerales bacterium]